MACSTARCRRTSTTSSSRATRWRYAVRTRRYFVWRGEEPEPVLLVGRRLGRGAADGDGAPPAAGPPQHRHAARVLGADRGRRDLRRRAARRRHRARPTRASHRTAGRGDTGRIDAAGCSPAPASDCEDRLRVRVQRLRRDGDRPSAGARAQAGVHPTERRAHELVCPGVQVLNRDDDRQIVRDVRVGSDVRIWDFVNLYGCEIGDGSMVGTFVEIQSGVTIGRALPDPVAQASSARASRSRTTCSSATA